MINDDETDELHVELLMTMSQTFDKNLHQIHKKRQVRGEERIELGEKLKTETAFMLHGRLIEKHGSKSVNVPKLNTLHQISSENRKARLLHEDQITAIRILNHSKKYFGCFQNISTDPFICIFQTKKQIELTKTLKRVKICVDASGGFGKPIASKDEKQIYEIALKKDRPNFLYVAVVTDKISDKSVLAGQMLSESHSTETIKFWLKNVALSVRPEEFTCDFSRALLQAASKIFNKCSIDEYLIRVYKMLDEGEKVPKNWCFLRLDISHMAALISRWKVFKINCSKNVKWFYVKALCGMLKIESFAEMKVIKIH